MMVQQEMAATSNRPIAFGFGRGSEISGLSKNTLRRLSKAGRLKTVRVGRRRLVLFSSLNELLQNGSAMQ